MKYVVTQFFSSSECNEAINFIEKNGTDFAYTKNPQWDCKRVDQEEFKQKVLNRFKQKFQLEDFELRDFNISLTKYYDGRWLDLHLDQSSQITTVVVLSEDFNDGRFMISNDSSLSNGATKAVPLLGSVPTSKINKAKKIYLKKGECISFNGSELYHGVMPVNTGIRYALNIWMTNTDFKYITPSKKTLL